MFLYAESPSAVAQFAHQCLYAARKVDPAEWWVFSREARQGITNTAEIDSDTSRVRHQPCGRGPVEFDEHGRPPGHHGLIADRLVRTV